MMVSGAPDRTRTCDLVIRNHALYPAELREHNFIQSHPKPHPHFRQFWIRNVQKTA